MTDAQMTADKIPTGTPAPTPSASDVSSETVPLPPGTIENADLPSSQLLKVEESAATIAKREAVDNIRIPEERPAPGSTKDVSSASEPIPPPATALDAPLMAKNEVPIAHEPPQPAEGPSTVDSQIYTPLDRPLDVTDALSYLDAVKVQFNDQPDVYNRFLDIMKEFKNEIIDTPGVIQRVSYLFNGHATLVQGFNTFLPVGYRIECSTDAHIIRVTTPTGTTMQTTNDGTKSFSWTKGQDASRRPPEPRQRPDTVGHPSAPSPDPRSMPIDGQAIEPAVQYVQKIKQRCDPETYRQFLDILSQYHSKPDLIDEEEVSRQIAMLFKDAPDLRSDFRIFMPERSQQNLDDPAYVGSAECPRTSTPVGDVKGKRKLDSVMASGSASSLPQKRKRRAVEKERDREPVSVRPPPPASSGKKSKHPGRDSAPAYNQRNPPPSPPRRATQIPPPSRILPPNDDSQFFDNVRRMLDNRETYNEFLKIVNLFTQDFIDTARLIRESQNFLGDGELLKQFKNILGWSERKEREAFAAEQQAQFGWTRPVIGGVLDRPNHVELDMKYGSYRRLPASETNVTCSGRDDMCRSVLNDGWVSHATWSNDDMAGFTAHRKNIYEEALHRSEEERHEYDFHIEAIVRTIALLEPYNSKIAQFSPEERAAFKLKSNMGGSWKSIHSRVVKKIYGRDAGLDVIQALEDTPSLAIPVVLQRLKQKEDEWKRAQREWNKVWREVDARNYMKSLDHQAIYFKADDKKTITTKAFVSQIEAAREEQMAKRASLIDPLFARARPRHQLEFVVDDVQVLQDVLKLTFSFLDRTQAQINFGERKRIEGFLRSFVPLFFALDPVAFNSSFVVVQETMDSEMSDDLGSIADDVEVSSNHSGGSRPARTGRKNGANISSGGDLRKKLLKSEQAKSTSRKTRAQDASPAISRLASPAPADEESRADVQRKLSRRNIFFTNTIFYVLLRLLEVLYSRLVLFKVTSAKAAADSSRRANPAAYNLGMASQINDCPASPEHYYELLLESLERLFDNEIEQHVFEDQMRYMFGTKEAYKTFTIDKVIGAIIKQVQNVLVDGKSQDLLEILKRERALLSPTTQDQINSRRSVEKVLGPDENLFRIDWLPEPRMMTVQLIGKDDSSFDDSEVLTGRWQAYIQCYVSSETTDGVSPSKVKLPYLRRNLPPAVRDVPPNVISQDGLEIKICVRTYRLFFVSKTEDFLWRISSREEMRKAVENLRARDGLRQKWLRDTMEDV